MAGKTGKSGLGLGCVPVDDSVHFAGQHQGRVVATAAPLAFGPSDSVLSKILIKLHVLVYPLVPFIGAVAHASYGGFIKRIVEGGKSVGRGFPLLDNILVAPGTCIRSNRRVLNEAILIDLPFYLLCISQIATGDDS